MRSFPGGTSRQAAAGSSQLVALADGGGRIIGTDINFAVPPLFAGVLGFSELCRGCGSTTCEVSITVCVPFKAQEVRTFGDSDGLVG